MTNIDILDEIDKRLKAKGIKRKDVSKHFDVTGKCVYEWFVGKPGNVSLNRIIELADMADVEITLVDKQLKDLSPKDKIINLLQQIIDVLNDEEL